MASIVNTIDKLSSRNRGKRAVAVFNESKQYTGITPPGLAKKTQARSGKRGRGGGRALGPITTPLAVR